MKSTSKWLIVFFLAVPMLVFYFLYQSSYLGLTVYTLNRAFADTAYTLISLSLIAAGFFYFTKKGQQLVTYRKYLGIAGFFSGFTHALISVYFYFFAIDPLKPNFEFGHIWPLIGSLQISNTVAFIFGITADLIFAFMALISIKFFILKLGGILWRKLLRYLGYTAYVFVTIHYFIKSADLWQRPNTWSNLPPMTIFLFIIGLTVLIFRICLFFSLRKKQKTLPAS
jgi:DMSO/TMAO reductase YedYZ heme-binding membrane subunit